MTEERYVFNCEWHDTQASLIRTYQMTFYPKDNTVEMYDKKNRRLFLVRVFLVVLLAVVLVAVVLVGVVMVQATVVAT